MWDPTVGLGTVTHEQIGYLFPLGPFFWAVHALGHPAVGGPTPVGGVDAVRRPGSGVLVPVPHDRARRARGRSWPPSAYMLSPYWLQDMGRIGSLVLPWAGLGWMVGLRHPGRAQGGWRYPALFALVWFTVSGINASGPVYAVVAPALWLLYAVFVAKEHTLRQAWATVWRIVVLTAGVSLWWAWALAIESGYGLNVLGVTEKVSAVAKTSLSSEVLRGLGYWFFYGSDIAGPWAATSAGFTQQLWLIGVTFAVPLLALGGRASSSAGATGPSSSSSSWWAWCSPSGSNPYAAPSTVGGVHQGLHDQDDRGPGPAVDRPGHAHGAARTGHAPRRRRHRPGPAPPDRGARRRRVWRWRSSPPPTPRSGTAPRCSTATPSPRPSRPT